MYAVALSAINTVHSAFVNSNIAGFVPSTIFEAVSFLDSTLWTQAIDKEISTHKENGTCSYTTLPDGHRAIGCRWVFHYQRHYYASNLQSSAGCSRVSTSSGFRLG